MSENDDSNVQVHVNSLYGHRTKRGLVHIHFAGSKREVGYQISPAEARRVGRLLIECAEAAETDEFLVGWLRQGDINEENAARLLMEFRKFRTAKHGSEI